MRRRPSSAGAPPFQLLQNELLSPDRASASHSDALKFVQMSLDCSGDFLETPANRDGNGERHGGCGHQSSPESFDDTRVVALVESMMHSCQSMPASSGW